ncbi:lipid IV(A) 3-deoxy-D-manno-octulosonic acid transferase [Vibrio paucivorans]
MATLIRWCYTIVLAMVSPLLLFGLYRSKPNKPKFGKRWKEHFGFVPPLQALGKEVIWVHAVSVGEVLAAKKFVASLQDAYPDKQLLVTTTTSTGAEQVSAFEGNVQHRYMPIDFSWCVNRFLRVVTPEALFIIETEIWPNTIHSVAKSGVPITLVNGRLSAKSARNYDRLAMLMAPTLNKMDMILAVHDDDKQRFESLGVAKGKVISTGSIKYDVSVDNRVLDQGIELRSNLGSDRKVLIAASTHQGEDEQVLLAFEKLKSKLPEALLILVPRHPERFDDVEKLIIDSGFSVSRRSSGETTNNNVDVYLGDTMGELMVMLAASDLVFMGGTLLGKKVGGHNYIEPALLKKYCLTGPSYFNFADIAKQLIAAKALEVVEDSNELSEQAYNFFVSLTGREELGSNAYGIVQKNQGALGRTLDVATSMINETRK